MAGLVILSVSDATDIVERLEKPSIKDDVLALVNEKLLLLTLTAVQKKDNRGIRLTLTDEEVFSLREFSKNRTSIASVRRLREQLRIGKKDRVSKAQRRASSEVQLKAALEVMNVDDITDIDTEEEGLELARTIKLLGGKPGLARQVLRRESASAKIRSNAPRLKKLSTTDKVLRRLDAFSGTTSLFPAQRQRTEFLAPAVSKKLDTARDRAFLVSRGIASGTVEGIGIGTARLTGKAHTGLRKASVRGAKEVRRVTPIVAKEVRRVTPIVARTVREQAPVVAAATRRGIIQSSRAAKRGALVTGRGVQAGTQVALAATSEASKATIRGLQDFRLPRNVREGISTRISEIKTSRSLREAERTAGSTTAVSREMAQTNLLFSVGIGPENWNPLSPPERRELLKNEVGDEQFLALIPKINFNAEISISSAEIFETEQGRRADVTLPPVTGTQREVLRRSRRAKEEEGRVAIRGTGESALREAATQAPGSELSTLDKEIQNELDNAKRIGEEKSKAFERANPRKPHDPKFNVMIASSEESKALKLFK